MRRQVLVHTHRHQSSGAQVWSCLAVRPHSTFVSALPTTTTRPLATPQRTHASHYPSLQIKPSHTPLYTTASTHCLSSTLFGSSLKVAAMWNFSDSICEIGLRNIADLHSLPLVVPCGGLRSRSKLAYRSHRSGRARTHTYVRVRSVFPRKNCRVPRGGRQKKGCARRRCVRAEAAGLPCYCTVLPRVILL